MLAAGLLALASQASAQWSGSLSGTNFTATLTGTANITISINGANRYTIVDNNGNVFNTGATVFSGDGTNSIEIGGSGGGVTEINLRFAGGDDDVNINRVANGDVIRLDLLGGNDEVTITAANAGDVAQGAKFLVVGDGTDALTINGGGFTESYDVSPNLVNDYNETSPINGFTIFRAAPANAAGGQFTIDARGIQNLDMNLASGNDDLDIEDLQTVLFLETVDIDGGQTNDTITVRPSTNVTYDIAGDVEELKDTLIIDTQGLPIYQQTGDPQTGGSVTLLSNDPVSNPMAPVNYDGFEVLNIVNQPCVYSLDKYSANIGSGAAAAQSFNVLTSEGSVCPWVIESDQPWLTFDAPQNDASYVGIGSGAVTYSVAANAGVFGRTATVSVATNSGTLFFTVYQAGTGCTFSLVDSLNTGAEDGAITLNQAGQDVAYGGIPQFAVLAATGCQWEVIESASWLDLVTPPFPTGTGTGANQQFSLTVQPNNGPARSTTIYLKDRTSGDIVDQIIVSQASGCVGNVTIDSFVSVFGPRVNGAPVFPNALGAQLFDDAILITNSTGCTWTATETESFINFRPGTPTTGVGIGQANFQVNQNNGPARTGTIFIDVAGTAGDTSDDLSHVVSQASGCYIVTPDATTVNLTAAAVASTTVNINNFDGNDVGCTWSATSDSDWITLTTANGDTTADLDFAVIANDGPARTGKITVTGDNGSVIVITVNQESGCTPTISGNIVNFSPAENTGLAVVSITDSVNDTQEEQKCRWVAVAVEDVNGNGTYEIMTDIIGPNWIQIVDGQEGMGNGPVTYQVAENNGAERKGLIVAISRDNSSAPLAALAFTQAACDLTAPSNDPASDATFEPLGGNGAFAVEMAAGGEATCDWTATTSSSWITINSGPSGNGDGVVSYSVAENNGASRTGTITVTLPNGDVGQWNITQNTCALVTPDNNNATDASFSPLGDTGAFNVTFVAGGTETCDWTAATSDAWITITSGPSGNGNGVVTFKLAENNGATRNGTITVTLGNGDQGQWNIEQATCDLIAPADDATVDANFAVNGGNGSFDVDFAAGGTETCDWQAVSSASWLVVNNATGNGDSSVSYTVADNNATQAARQATITVTLPNGDQGVWTVEQEAASLAGIPAANFTHDGGAGSFVVDVNEADASASRWTVTLGSTDPAGDTSWLSIQSGIDGAGDGLVSYEVAPHYNDTTAPRQRTGSITVTLENGVSQTLNITQTDTCSPIVAAGSGGVSGNGLTVGTPRVFNHSAQAGTILLTGELNSCPWNVSTAFTSGNSTGWVSVQEIGGGVGNATLHFEVAEWQDDNQNNAQDVRTATITVTGDNGLSSTYFISQTPDCTITAPDNNATNDATFTHDGGNGTFPVTFSTLGISDCDWIVSVASTDPAGDTSWFSVTSGIDGRGNGQINYVVNPLYNDTTAPRQRVGTITVRLPNGLQGVHTFTQNDTCAPDLAAGSGGVSGNGTTNGTPRVFNHSAQSGTILLTGELNSCPWNVSTAYTSANSTGWVSVQEVGGGVGNAVLHFEVAEWQDDNQNNALDVRTATITVTGDNGLTDTYFISQTPDCDIQNLAGLDATGTFDQNGGNGSFPIVFSTLGISDCDWMVSVDARIEAGEPESWISIQSGIDGRGNGIVTYEVKPFYTNPNNQAVPAPFRSGTITVRLPNGRSITHVVNQTDYCLHELDATATNANQAERVYSFDVNMTGADPNANEETPYDCPWIVRVRFDPWDCECDSSENPVAPEEEWIKILEGSTEGSGDGLVTFLVEKFKGGFGCSRVGYIDVILDNGYIQTHTVTQSDDCSFTLTPNEFNMDHNGRLTGPVFDPAHYDSNTGTGWFDVNFLADCEQCDWTAEVVDANANGFPINNAPGLEDDQWINIIEGSSGVCDGQVHFQIDPNVVPGKDKQRTGLILVKGSNCYTQGVVIYQDGGYFLLKPFQLADPGSEPNPVLDFGYGENNVVVGYTNLDDEPNNIPNIKTVGFADSRRWTAVQNPNASKNIRTEVEPHLFTDANGSVLGFFTVTVLDDLNGGTQLAEFDLPVNGRFYHRRSSVTVIDSPLNNYEGTNTTTFNNSLALRGTAKGLGTVTITGAEKYKVMPIDHPGTPPGFTTKISVNVVQGLAATKSKNVALVEGWNPTPANVAISKNSLKKANPKLTKWKTDLLLLNTEADPDGTYAPLGEQMYGDALLQAVFQPTSRNGKPSPLRGTFRYEGQLGARRSNAFRVSGRWFITNEAATEEGFWFDKLKRGTTIFPTAVRFANEQVVLTNTIRWNNALLVNPVEPPVVPSPTPATP